MKLTYFWSTTQTLSLSIYQMIHEYQLEGHITCICCDQYLKRNRSGSYVFTDQRFSHVRDIPCLIVSLRGGKSDVYTSDPRRNRSYKSIKSVIESVFSQIIDKNRQRRIHQAHSIRAGDRRQQLTRPIYPRGTMVHSPSEDGHERSRSSPQPPTARKPPVRRGTQQEKIDQLISGSSDHRVGPRGFPSRMPAMPGAIPQDFVSMLNEWKDSNGKMKVQSAEGKVSK